MTNNEKFDRAVRWLIGNLFIKSVAEIYQQLKVDKGNFSRFRNGKRPIPWEVLQLFEAKFLAPHEMAISDFEEIVAVKKPAPVTSIERDRAEVTLLGQMMSQLKVQGELLQQQHHEIKKLANKIDELTKLISSGASKRR